MPQYLVIARKWRPGLFEEIVGQEHVTRTLTNAIASGKTAHAYLFAGPRGVGKTTAARILAKCLNCEKGPTAVPCNSCSSCSSVAAGSSVDVYEIDAASNTGVDNVRELKESVKYLPGQGKYKVYIIDEAHMLSDAAFNALLKTLEEPPPHVVFVFATTEVHKIPQTILSRCQRFDFKRIPYARIHSHLKAILEKEGVEFDDGALHAIARVADGSLRDAQSLLDQALAYSGGSLKGADVVGALGLMDRTTLFDLAGALVGNDSAGCLKIIEKMHEFGYDFKKASADLLEVLRDLAVVKVCPDSGLVDASDAEMERFRAMAASAGIERLQMLFSVVSKGYEDVSRSAYPRYALEMALLKGAYLGEVDGIAAIVGRLERLSASSGAAPVRREEARRPEPRPSPVAQSRPAAPAKGPAAPVVLEERAAVSAPAASDTSSAYAEGAGDLVGFLKGRIKALAEPLSAAVVRVAGGVVELAVSPDKFAAFRIKEREIEEACRDFLKRPVKVELAKSAAPAAAGPRASSAGADAVVREAVRAFGAKVIEDTRRGDV